MKNRNFILLTGLSILMTVFTHSCYYDNEAELYPGACDLSDTRYQSSVVPIVEANCLGCHSGTSPDGGILLEGYSALIEHVDDGSFGCSINWESGCSQMPKNASQLSTCDLTIINLWIASGALDN